MAGYWPHSFLCVFMDLDFVLVHKHTKKAILTSRLVDIPYIQANLSYVFEKARFSCYIPLRGKQKYQVTNVKSKIGMFATSMYYLTSKVNTNQE